MSVDATTMTCAGGFSTDSGYKVQSVGIVIISARTGIPLRYIPIQRFHAWVTGHAAVLFWASPTGADNYIAIQTDFANDDKAPAGLTVWRDGKVAGTIPWPD